MPTYEYLCQNCGYKFEKFQGINDEPLKTCPQCGANLKRLISKGGFFILKNASKLTTCCGRDTPCTNPPCSDSGICRRE